MTSKPRGRRPGPNTTRDTIVAAARHEFATRGYERATIRAIADRADVDPATIYHYFTDKQTLLSTALELPVDADTVAALLPTDRPLDTDHLLRTLLVLWQDPTVAEHLSAFIRVATNHPDAGDAASTFIHNALLERIASGIDAEDAELRAALIIGQIAGLAMVRLIIPLEPIENADIDHLANHIAPALQRLAHPPDNP